MKSLDVIPITGLGGWIKLRAKPEAGSIRKHTEACEIIRRVHGYEEMMDLFRARMNEPS